MGEATSEVKKSYARRFARGSTIVFTTLIVSSVIGLILRIFLARTLTVADYGLFYAVFALVSLFGLFREPGIGQAIVKYIPEFVVKKRLDLIKSSITVLMLFQVLFSLSISLILIAFSDQMAITIFGTAEASLVIKILSGWFLFVAIFYTFKTPFQGFQEMVPHSLLGFLEIVLPLIFAFFFIGIFGPSPANFAFAYLAGLAITSLIAFGLFLKKHSDVLSAKMRISKPLLKKLFAFALPAFIGGFGALIIGYMDTLMITMFRSLPEVGFYQVAKPAASLLHYFPMAISIVLFPMISELWARREQKLVGQAMHIIIKFSFIFIIPAALILIAFPDVVITLLFGSEYLAASIALQILTFTAVVYTLSAISGSMLAGIGKPAIVTMAVGITACFNFVLNLILIPPYGIEGAAIATFLSMLVGLSISLHFARRFVRFTIPSSSLLKALGGGLLALLMIFGLKLIIDLPPIFELPIPEFFVVMTPSLIFYAAWILRTKTLTWGDLLLLKNAMPIPKWLLRVARKFIKPKG